MNAPDKSSLKSKLATLEGIISRPELFRQLGQQYDGDRDMYVTLGYKKDLVYDDFFSLYKRQDICKRIIDAPADATWRGEPIIVDLDADEDDKDDKDDDGVTLESEFNRKFSEIARALKIWHYFTRADKLAGVGQYSVLFLGFNDAKTQNDLAKEVKRGNSLELTHLRPFSEGNAEIMTFDDDVNSPRHGLPETYQLQTSLTGTTTATESNKTIVVHWTRVIHVAEDLLESETFGTPRLEAVFNRMFDLEKTVGGNAEMFWRGAFPGYNFKLDPEAELADDEITDLQDQIDNMIHKISRYIRTQGVDIQELKQEVADPSSTFDVIIKLISAATGIPTRILTGSERGELASSQDESNWNTRIDERRNDFAVPIIIRPFIERLILFGILPVRDFNTVWPDPLPLDAETISVVNKNQTSALVEYAESIEAQLLIPPIIYLTRFANIDEDTALQIIKDREGDLDDEDDLDFDDDEPDDIEPEDE